MDASDLYALRKRIENVTPNKLRAAMNRSLRESANVAVEAVRDEVMNPAPGKIAGVSYGTRKYRSKNGVIHSKRVVTGHTLGTRGRSRSRGLRAAIASSVTARTRSSAKKATADIAIVADAKKMPPGMGPMVKAYNTTRFRHPVFADSLRQTRNQWRWVYQAGHPYFGSVIVRQRLEIERRLEAAMDDINRQIAGDLH